MESELSPRRVVFYGDSRAAWWVAPRAAGLQCTPCGFPGATAAYVLQRLPGALAPLRPDVVVVQVGVNDLVELTYGRWGQARVAELLVGTIAAIVAGARGLGARVVLTTIFPVGRGPLPDRALQAAIAELNDLLRGLAAPGVALLDSAAALADPDGYVRDAYAADELHLSAAGYRALNAALLPLLG